MLQCKPYVIGIAGDSGAGKSRLAKQAAAMLGETHVTVLCMDGYHKETRQQRAHSGILPLDPKANDLARACRDVSALKEGRAINIPSYDHVSGTFFDEQMVQCREILLIEGLHVLYPELSSVVDFGIFLDPSTFIKQSQKLSRDMRERGYDAQCAHDKIAKRNGSFEKWIVQQREAADLSIAINSNMSGEADITLPDLETDLELLDVDIVFQNRAMKLDFKQTFWGVVCAMAQATSNNQVPVRSDIRGDRVTFSGAFNGNFAANAEQAFAKLFGMTLKMTPTNNEQNSSMRVYDCLTQFCILPALAAAHLPSISHT